MCGSSARTVITMTMTMTMTMVMIIIRCGLNKPHSNCKKIEIFSNKVASGPHILCSESHCTRILYLNVD
jgi:hypothetical protein